MRAQSKPVPERISVLLRVLFLVLIGLVTGAQQKLVAQAVAGVTGTVTDSTEAVVPSAKVSVTNDASGVTVETQTGSAGTYHVTGLLPSSYTITVEASGFKKTVKHGVLIEVSSIPTVDFTLAQGAVTESVEVTASSIALNTTQPQIGTTIEPEVVAALPVEVAGRGRQIDALQFLAPGTTGSSFSHRTNGGVDFQQEVVYNGVPFPQPETEGYTTNVNPPFEMIQEFRVERSNFAAQYGLGQGAITYNFASGTNSIHGSAFEINRNSFFDSAGFFNNKYWSSTPGVPTDHENNYGFAFGLPIVIPKLYNGRNKTFFHYTQEWYKQNNEDTGISTVPTALEKTGDFSDFVNATTGDLIPIYDPVTGQQFQYNGKLNVIPPSQISATSQAIIPFIPNPDRPGSGANGLDDNKSFTPFINPHIQHNWGFTVDHNLTDRQGIHYSQWRDSFSNYSFDNNPLVVAPNPLNSMKFEPALGSGFVLNYSYAVKPNLVVTAGAGWFGEINNQFNITNYSPTEVAGSSIPPYITFDGQHTLTSWGTQGSWLRSINRKLGLAFSNNYLWTKGKNTFNIGWEFRRAYQDDNEEQTAGGQFAFSQAQTSIHNPNDPNYGADGSSFASFLLGLPNAVNRSNSQELRLRNRDLSPYIQDDIKLSRKLTLNVGLRWDIQVPFTENNNLIVFFDPSIANPAADGLSGAVTKFGDCTGCAGYTHADIHWGHVGPRFGASYQLNDKTVLQGGFSVSFLNGGAYEYGTNKVAVNYGNLLVGAFSRASTGSFTSSYGSWDAQQLVNPPATPFSNGLGVGTQVDAFNRNDGYAPYSEQWNFSIQRELPSGIFFTAAWIGNREVHLTSQLNAINQLDPKFLALGNDLGLSFFTGTAQAAGYTVPYANFVNDFQGSATVNQSLVPFPQFGKIFNNFEGSGTAYYQSGQIEVEKRFKKGLAFLAGYTLSRSWDNTSSGFSSFTNGALNKFNQKLEWGASTSDEPNTLKVSGTYELPFGPNKPFANKHGVVGQIVGGWQVGWVLDYEAGTAFGVGENGTPFPTIGGGNRPDRNGAVKLSTSSYKNELDFYLGKGQGQIFANNSFTTTPSQYVLGNSQRAYFELRNPHFMNENLNALRTFNFGEHLKGKLQVAYFNAFNRVQFNGPDTNASDGAAFGQAHSQGQNNGNRQGQAMFRLEF